MKKNTLFYKGILSASISISIAIAIIIFLPKSNNNISPTDELKSLQRDNIINFDAPIIDEKKLLDRIEIQSENQGASLMEEAPSRTDQSKLAPTLSTEGFR
ncbi:MAG: hypothetical protein V4726_18185 [Verrucomicrobiota bacterium]